MERRLGRLHIRKSTTCSKSLLGTHPRAYTDGHDVTGLAFVHVQDVGKFEFDIDDVEIK
jgi:predicted glutamine amidotransferase